MALFTFHVFLHVALIAFHSILSMHYRQTNLFFLLRFPFRAHTWGTLRHILACGFRTSCSNTGIWTFVSLDISAFRTAGIPYGSDSKPLCIACYTVS